MRTLTRRPLAVLLAGSVTAAAGLGIAAAPVHAAGPYDGKTIISEGHVDALYTSQVDGAPYLHLHDDTVDPDVGRAAEDVVFHVKPSAHGNTVNQTSADYFNNNLTGFDVQDGDTVYILPQNNVAGTIFAGWGYDGSLPPNTSITYNITSFSGTGDFATYISGTFGDVTELLNSNVVDSNFTSTANHAHKNWIFTEPGEYQVTVQADVTRPAQATQQSNSAVYTFWIGEELPTDPDPTTTDLTISGMPDHVHTGDSVTLTANMDPALDLDEHHFHWFVTPEGGTEQVIPGEIDQTYTFTAQDGMDGNQYVAKLYNDDTHALVGESDPVELHIDDHVVEPPEGSQIITALLDEHQGALVVSIDPNDDEVVMSPFELSDDAQRWESTGELRPVQVTDTRAGKPGFTVSGQAGEFHGHDDEFGSEYLGWSPTVASQSDGQGVVAGDVVAPGASDGDGLSSSRPLASAPAGSGLGTATLGAGLDLHAPTSIEPGTYTSILTVTAI